MRRDTTNANEGTSEPTIEMAASEGVPRGLPAGTVSWVETRLDALSRNLALFRERLGPACRIAAVVKSDAYGHGVSLVAPRALGEGAFMLAVVNLTEALELRRLVGQEARVIVLGHVPPDGFVEAARAGAELTIYSRGQLPALAAAAERAGAPLRLHVKLETGTHRQGLGEDEACALALEIARTPGLVLEGLSTHFADVEDTTDHAFAREQLRRFEAGVARLGGEGLRVPLRHAACSAAALLFSDSHFDLARVGIGLYGLWPSRETLVSARERGIGGLELEPVMSWKCRVAQVKAVPIGSYVGYGRTWRAGRPSRIAVLPIGYYEGYERALSSRAHVLIRGHRAPVVGRVCMNMTMVDVTDVPEAHEGDVAVLLGRSGDELVRAEDLAGWAGTIHYEIVARVGASLPRVALGT